MGTEFDTPKKNKSLNSKVKKPLKELVQYSKRNFEGNARYKRNSTN
jgi:hypothetical protein